MPKLLRIILLGVVFFAGCDQLYPDNKNTSLSELTITGVSLSPAFDPEVTSYTVTVDSRTAQALIEATATNRKATVLINGTHGGSSSASATIQFAVGQTTISILVVAEDTDRSRTYTIIVTRPPPTYTIGGSVSGLTGTLMLQNNGGDDLSLNADGPFTFATAIDDGSDYDVTVGTQPDGLVCSVENGSGTVAGADITNVAVTCVIPTHTVGGSVSGLDGTLVLQNNAGDDLSLTANGEFTFATAIEEGSDYNVTVATQPEGQLCSIENGAGTMGTADVTNVTVTCIVPLYSVGGTLSGLSGSVTLQNNGGDDLTRTENGSFTFATELMGGANYSVSVSAQPAGQLCTVTNGAGIVAAANVDNVDVSCVNTGGGVSSGWVWRNPLPQGNDLEDIVWTGSQFVAVGAYGTIRTSPDGLVWTTRDSGTTTHLRGVAWNGNKLIAVGTSSSILSSDDGVTWSSADAGFNASLNKILWDGSQFVAVGSGINSQVATSPDGVTWTARNASTFYVSLVDVAWNGTTYVAVASGSGIYNYVYTSSNAITWTRYHLGPWATGRSITTDGTQFVVPADRYVLTSLDGETWDLRLSSNDNPYSVYASLWDGSQFILSGGNAILTSPDGITWTPQAGLGLGSVQSLETSGSQYLGVGRYGNTVNSPDLVAWTTQLTGPVSLLMDLLWTGELYVAVGNTVIMTSPDGIAWTRRDQNTPAPWPNSASLNAVAWSGSLFVTVGYSGDLLTSADGLTWAPGSSGVGAALNDLLWDGNQFVVVGSAGTIRTSPDATTWTSQTSSTEGVNLNIIGWNGAQFVTAGLVVGGNLAIMTSPDAVTWTNQSISARQYSTPEDIIWDGAQWLLVTTFGVYTSPDGQVWTAQTSGVPDLETFSCIAYTGTQYIMPATSSLVLTSEDGVNWTGSQYAITGRMQRIIWDGEKLVTVGNYGSILNYSEPL
jgi:hypothetical protein